MGEARESRNAGNIGRIRNGIVNMLTAKRIDELAAGIFIMLPGLAIVGHGIFHANAGIATLGTMVFVAGAAFLIHRHGSTKRISPEQMLKDDYKLHPLQ